MSHGVCQAKDCDVVICDADSPILTENPPRRFENDRARRAAIVVVANGAEDLYGVSAGDAVRLVLLKIPVLYNNRLSSAIGRCVVIYDPPTDSTHPKKIEITGKYQVPDEFIHGLLVHEFCHATRSIVSSDYMTEKAHGRLWQDLMVASGELPNTTCIDPAMLTAIRQQDVQAEALRTGRPARHVAPVLSRADFRIGDKVAFYARVGGVDTRHEGRIHKKNEKTAGVYVPGERGRWRIGYSGLEKR